MIPPAGVNATDIHVSVLAWDTALTSVKVFADFIVCGGAVAKKQLDIKLTHSVY